MKSHLGDLLSEKIGADGRTRTADLLMTNQLLYRLSCVGWGFLKPTVFQRARGGSPLAKAEEHSWDWRPVRK